MTPIDILEGIGIRVDPCREDLGPTRDRQDVRAYRDPSGFVYLSADVGHDYSGKGVPKPTQQMQRDDKRRCARIYLSTTSEDNVLDFGCGVGGFVCELRLHGVSAFGVDPCWLDSDSYSPYIRQSLTHIGLYPNERPTVVTAFHVVEHLSDPVATLTDLRGYMADDARLIVEVPNARDWLLCNCEAFRRFSLWSEHLILHTRETLSALLRASGFVVDRVEGFQRYPHSNHMHWLTDGKPGCFDVDEDLDRAYAASLARRDMTDTLIAWARKG